MYDPIFHREMVLNERKTRALRAKGVIAMDGELAFDAQAQTTTVPNSGIPSFLSTFVDRDILQILFAPMKAAAILGDERKVGDWTTKTSMFPVAERTGDVSAYGDYSENGSAGANFAFPQRQSYHFQTMVQYGEKEIDTVALAGINLVSEKKEGATLAINKFGNRTYLFGVAGLQNYGILNDPSLPASIQPGPKAYNSQAHGPWMTAGVPTATPNEVFIDFQTLFAKLVSQSNGIVELSADVPLVLTTDPTSQIALTSANSFGVTAIGLIKAAFPNVRLETAVEYATAAGNVVQLMAEKVEGQRTGFTAFTEKLRAHRVVQHTSSWLQKISQGTWGAIIRQPFTIATMLGV